MRCNENEVSVTCPLLLMCTPRPCCWRCSFNESSNGAFLRNRKVLVHKSNAGCVP